MENFVQHRKLPTDMPHSEGMFGHEFRTHQEIEGDKRTEETGHEGHGHMILPLDFTNI